MLCMNFFQNLNKERQYTDENDENFSNMENENSFVNSEFTNEEIKDAVKSLKNCKSPGIDLIINKFIKSTIDILCPLYTKLFNKILEIGLVPECWSTGIIIPIDKNKGSMQDANNYHYVIKLHR